MKPKIKIILASFFLAVLLTANFASAQLITCGGRNPDGSAQTGCQLVDMVFTVERIINYLLAWAWLVSIFFILWAGWEMMNSGGNQERITVGKDTFKHAIIGFFLIMSAYLLVNVIVGLLTSTNPGAGALDNILKNIR
ncbi:MAG: hypothetical protein A3B10_02830 [Candidatus Doudnabacteria bacterium RIFCSPLOWO2_01_FULL_44_21]|uniref:Uncharacterized protein n=1 Tax=Candidatus Doudnabacteria bacterium RIFCSPLOWO2_01_FULL_44_21 TaxID=1817841 RepID=A0A1F5Q2Q1_9BACT|nr:MAG: hypothetical protein A3B95_03100 [Candidatus Doudnabacteria bacterium RIFCSPHIGHO2_02_FULL_43_13b]OGE96222.1 MAG: hypothetical protein A3B10_02830 [Candidatus Doudnabacteria bacterium RIFCSPLOWO2_01_FULL_44_21]